MDIDGFEVVDEDTAWIHPHTAWDDFFGLRSDSRGQTTPTYLDGGKSGSSAFAAAHTKAGRYDIPGPKAANGTRFDQDVVELYVFVNKLE